MKKSKRKVKNKHSVTSLNETCIEDDITKWMANIDCFEDDLFSESQLLGLLLKKYKTNILQNIKLFKKPKFLEVQDIEIILNPISPVLDYPVNCGKVVKKNCISVEPVFIEYPSLLKLLYNKKKIKYKTSDIDNGLKKEDFLSKESLEYYYQEENEILNLTMDNKVNYFI